MITLRAHPDSPWRKVRARFASGPRQLRAALLAVLLLSPAAAAATGTVVTLGFDDCFADQLLGATMLSSRGLHGVFYVNSGRFGQPGRMTAGQVLQLQLDGHEVGGHSVSHPDLPTLDADEQRRQICNDRVALLGLGLAPTSFAYPYGDETPVTQQIVSDCGYDSARGVGDIVSPGTCYGCAFAELIPPSNPFATKTPDSVKIGTSLADMQLYVTQAEDNGGGWVQIVMHHVCDGCDPYSVSPTTLSAFLDWLAARAAIGTVVRTPQQVMGGPLKPGVNGPPPPPPAPGMNLLHNPSLEADVNVDGKPDCWQLGGTGTNTYSWSRTNDAQDGSFAERVDITSFTNGARRLVSQQDLGSCAPSVWAGHTYTVGTWYKTDSLPRFVAYYRSASGGWTWWAQSAEQPASASYARATWTTPAVPAGATAISIGLSLLSVGSLTVDSFTLVDQDTTPPSVTMTSPASGDVLSGTVTLTATASDAGGVDHVDFLVGGSVVGSTSGTYSMPWDTRTATASNVSIAARAVDHAGNATLSAASLVTISNAPPTDTVPPTVALTAPADGAAVRGVVTVSATASDNVAVQHVDFLVGGSLTGSASAPPYRFDWDTGTAAEGPVTVVARAFDTSGNRADASIGVWVDRNPPSVAFDSPANGAVLTGPVQVSATATDAAGVLRVDFFANGTPLGSVASPPYAITFDAASWPNGPITFTAIAYDHAGNRSPTASVSASVFESAPDVTPPTSSVSCNGGSCSGGWYTAPVTVALSAVDLGGSGLAEIVYTTDGSLPALDHGTAYAGPFVVAASAVVQFRAWDNAGNAEGTRSQAILVDGLAPVTTATCNGAACATWYPGSPATVTFALLAGDGGSGVAAVRYTVDGTDPDLSSPLSTGPLAVASSTAFRYRAWDAAGNVEAVRFQNVLIDPNPGSTSIACNGGSCASWFNAPVAVSLTATDTGGSGVEHIRYTTDGTDPSLGSAVYSTAFLVSTLATVKFRVWDVAGNVEPVRSQLVQVDAVSPTAAVASPASGASVTGTRVAIVAAVSDNTAVTRVRFYYDGTHYLGSRIGAPWQWYWDTSALAKGAHTIAVQAEDAAGNVTRTAPVTVSVY